MLMKPIAIAAATALTLAAAFGWWQYNRAEGLAERLTQSEERRAADRLQFERARAELQRSIVVLEQQRARDQEQMDRLSAEASRITEERDAEKAKLDGYRSRISRAATARPGLVGRLATSATGRLFDEFHRATRADRGPDGGGQEVSPAPAAGGPPAGQD